MPTLAHCVDAASRGYAAFFAEEGSLAASVPFSSIASTTAAAAIENSNPLANLRRPSLSAALYRIDAWGRPCFSVKPSGNISVRPYDSGTLPHQEIDLLKVVKKVSDPKSVGGLGLQLPLILQLPDVLKNRLEPLQSAFDFAVQSQGYGAHYQGVYPVKCNQDRFAVEDIVRFGSPVRFGLEAGSKPELLLAVSRLCKGSPEALLVCNGFKDSQIQHFLHRPSKAYSTATRRRRIHTDEDGSETRWQETGNTQPVLIGGTMKGFKKILGASFLRNAVTKVICIFTGSELHASEQELLHEPDDAIDNISSGFCSSIDDESIRKRRKPRQSKSGDMVPASSAPPAEVQLWGCASHTALSKPAQPVAFGHMNGASSTGHNSTSLGSGNQAGSLPQMGLPAFASCRPKDQQPWAGDFKSNQNAAPRPAAEDQNPHREQAPGNPEIREGGHPMNQNATPRPVDRSQEPNYLRAGIGSPSVNRRVHLITFSAGLFAGLFIAWAFDLLTATTKDQY